MNKIMSIQLDKVIADPKFSAITKMTAMRLQQMPYMTLGEWFQSLSNNDIIVLNFMTELAITDIDVLGDLIILTEMLSRAEQAEALNPEDARDNVNFFLVAINCVSLARKGLVKVTYENMSFGHDMRDKEFVVLNDVK